MNKRSSTASRLLVCLVVAVLLFAGGAGVVAADDETTDSLAAGTGGETTLLTDTLDETADDVENVTDELVGDDDTVDWTGDSSLDGEANESTDDEVGDDDLNETADDEQNDTDDIDVVGWTTGALDTVVLDPLSVALSTSVGLEPVTGTTNVTVDETVSVDVDANINDGGDGTTDDADGPDDEDDEDDDGVPTDGSSTATDAVLVGLLGAITASGAASGGVGGAAAGTSGLTASWVNTSSGSRQLERIGRFLPWGAVPILKYSRYDDSDPLENDRRRAVYETIAAEPGTYLSQVSERSDVALSTVRHHVRVLEEEGLVTATKVNGKRRYYLDDDPDEGAPTDADVANVELHAALQESAKRDVLEALSRVGASPNGRLADELDCDPSTVSHHLSSLEDAGLVIREKDGRSVVNELAAGVEPALRDDPSIEDEALEPSASAPADD